MKKLLEHFMKKNSKKTNQKEFRIEKMSLKEKKINYMLNEKDMIIHLIVGLIKKSKLNEISLYKNESIRF